MSHHRKGSSLFPASISLNVTNLSLASFLEAERVKLLQLSRRFSSSRPIHTFLDEGKVGLIKWLSDSWHRTSRYRPTPSTPHPLTAVQDQTPPPSCTYIMGAVAVRAEPCAAPPFINQTYWSCIAAEAIMMARREWRDKKGSLCRV